MAERGIKPPLHYRAVKARAVRDGEHDLVAAADLGLRAARMARAIQKELEGPPLPPEYMAYLRNLLNTERN